MDEFNSGHKMSLLVRERGGHDFMSKKETLFLKYLEHQCTLGRQYLRFGKMNGSDRQHIYSSPLSVLSNSCLKREHQV